MKLTDIRIQINEIDDQLKELFLLRMRHVQDVAEYKAKHGMPILDSQREQEMVERLITGVDPSIQSYYLSFLESYIKISKEFQTKLLLHENNKEGEIE